MALESYSQAQVASFVAFVQANISDPLSIARAALTVPLTPTDFAAVWNLAEGTSYTATDAENLYAQAQAQEQAQQAQAAAWA